MTYYYSSSLGTALSPTHAAFPTKGGAFLRDAPLLESFGM